MKRLLVVLLAALLLLSLSSCVKPKYESDGTEIVILPDEVTKQTVNGYKQPSVDGKPQISTNVAPEKDTETENTNNTLSAKYIANSSTKKFHLPTCQYAKTIKNENLKQTNSRSELTDNGYEPCKKCNP